MDHIGFNADLDPAFYLNADPDPDPGKEPMRIQADPDPGQTSKSHKKLNFYMKNIFKVDNRSKNIPTKVQKPF